MLSAGTGERIAVYRRRRGLSQAALAGGIGRSESASAERRGALCSYVSAYAGVAKLLTKLGVTDLAVVAADRAAGDLVREMLARAPGPNSVLHDLAVRADVLD
ncbi:MAG: hypothetical protein ACRDS0_30270 [Pseudonocardiaceae bacterium]